ncbi:hypothetical protein E2C01_006127 [Portunus trituberculatus]|uniref:Uncharacterized protein n=1 Tax=Portunus trituberculatus TaxID=210409 RepID=A0A5B7CXB1_PORTR|nr:hypothetical protein [Portunus trituberculatus]
MWKRLSCYSEWWRDSAGLGEKFVMQEGDVGSCEPQTQHLLDRSFDSTVNYKSPMSLHARCRCSRGHPPACRVGNY